MTATWTLGVLVAAALLLAWQFARAVGRRAGVPLGVLAVAAAGGGWWLLGSAAPPSAGPADWHAVASVPSDSCAKCHPDHYDSWHRTYHRTMTREATPENVKGDFADAAYDYQ